jgi:hypothetical protein
MHQSSFVYLSVKAASAERVGDARRPSGALVGADAGTCATADG